MHRIAQPDTASTAALLENHLWGVADQFCADSDLMRHQSEQATLVFDCIFAFQMPNPKPPPNVRLAAAAPAVRTT